MKAFLALFLFVAVASAAELYETRLLGNHLEDLVIEAFEYLRYLMKKHDPYMLPDIPEFHLVDTGVDFVVSATNEGLSDATDFTVDSVKVSPITLKASFQVTIPSGKATGNYKISGTGWEKKVEGSGTFSGEIASFVLSGSLQLGVVDHSIQVKSLSLDYSIGDLKLSVDGLEIDGYTKEEVDNLLNYQIINYLQNKESYVAERAAAHIKEIANKMLYGYSLADVIAIVEKLVASTPDPYRSLFPQ